MGKKSRRQRQRRPGPPAGDFPQDNKVITPDTKVPPLMRGTVRKNHAAYSLSSNQRFGFSLANVIALPSQWARCATSVTITRTFPSRVTWFVAGVASRATVRRRAKPRIGLSTSITAPGFGRRSYMLASGSSRPWVLARECLSPRRPKCARPSLSKASKKSSQTTS